MKKFYVRIITLVLSAALIVSTNPTPLSSLAVAEHIEQGQHIEQMNVNQTVSSAYDSQKSSELKPFTSTKDLVAAMKAELLLKGASNEVGEKEKQRLQELSETIEKKCGYTLTEIKSLLAISIFEDRDQDKVDVSQYNLSKDELKTIVDLVLEDYSAAVSTVVTIDADENGIAQTMTVDMNSGYEAGLDALDEMDGVGEMYPATEILEETETNNSSSYAKSAKATGSVANVDDTTVTSDVPVSETPDVPETPEPEEPGSEIPSVTPEVPETHTCSGPAFTWSEIKINEDIPYTCTAEFICDDCSIKETVNCTVTRDDTQELAIIYIATCEFNGKEYSTTRDASTEQLYARWGVLCTFYGASSEYYGLSTEYWTSKNTANSPFGALKVLAGMDIDAYVPAPNMDELIGGIAQAFQAYVYYYGDALLAAREDALESIDDTMTDLQKLLVLHDYLATHAVFDMHTLMNYQNEQQESDPITMTPFGALLYGKIKDFKGNNLKGCVCFGYASAYTYLVQSAFPEIYRNTDGTFKNYEEVIESGQDMVDFVMIKYNCRVEDVGVTHGEGGFEGTFNEPHYYNVVKLGDQWYNVDVCYDDIKTEVLTQYRVETDGNVSHMYFLVSNQTIEDWYEGYYDYIDTLHGTGSEEPCNDEQYEEGWFSKIDSPISYDDEYWYYVEAQFSDLDMMDMDGEEGSQYEDMDDEELADMMRDYGDQMKMRPRSASDLSVDEGTVLFDYGKGDVTDPNNVITEGLLATECEEDLQMNNIYPDLTHSVSLYNNRLYFNLNNKIFMYDLEDGTVTQIKEYNTVYAKSDGTPFTGSSYYITGEQDEELLFTIQNHPLAALCIKDDGIMYVSVATNYTNSECSKYKIESVNYNMMYNRFAEDNTEDDNDNSEFMWCANVKDNINMSDVEKYLSGGAELENVVVEPWCGKQGYTEPREKVHGFSAGTEKTYSADTKEHHYTFNDVEGCYICKRCYDALDPEDAGEVVTEHSYEKADFQWEELAEGGYSCKATIACEFKDATHEIDAIVTSKEEVISGDSDCKKVKNMVYTATCEFEGKTYTDTKTEEQETVVNHVYGEAEFKWDDSASEEYKCSATFTCKCGADVQTRNATVTSKEETTTGTTECDKVRNTIYTATCEFEGKTYTETKTEKVETVVNHVYGDPEFIWEGLVEGECKCSATFTCKCGADVQTRNATVTSKEETTTGTTECHKVRKTVYTATCEFEGKAYTATKTVSEEPTTAHTYGDPVFNWIGTDKGYTCEAIFKCNKCTDQQTIHCNVTSQSKTGEITYTASCSFNQKSYNNTKTVKVSPTPTDTGNPPPQPPIIIIPPQAPVTENKQITNLEIKNKDIKLGKNKSITLELQITPTDTTETELQFTSSNSTVATVTKEGIITGLQEGTATITVSTVDRRIERTVSVKVGEPVTSVVLNHTELSLVKNETSLLSVTITPDNAITKEVQFISLDESIATVDSSGKVTAVGLGETQIIVKSMDGSDIRVKCFVTVKQKLTELSISPITTQTYTGKTIKPEIIIKDDTYQLIYRKDYSLKWKNNKNVGTAQVTIVGNGNYTGTVEVTFVIKARPLKDVTISKVPNQIYTGNELKPSVKLTYNKNKLKIGRDYKLEYKSNTNTGKATIIIKGKGNYTGTKKIRFKIESPKVSLGMNVYGAYNNMIKVAVQ